jgi:hypothetical protein
VRKEAIGVSALRGKMFVSKTKGSQHRFILITALALLENHQMAEMGNRKKESLYMCAPPMTMPKAKKMK